MSPLGAGNPPPGTQVEELAACQIGKRSGVETQLPKIFANSMVLLIGSLGITTWNSSWLATWQDVLTTGGHKRSCVGGLLVEADAKDFRTYAGLMSWTDFLILSWIWSWDIYTLFKGLYWIIIIGFNIGLSDWISDYWLEISDYCIKIWFLHRNRVSVE